MVSRPEETQKRKAFASHDDAVTQLEKARSRIDTRLRIAAVGYRVQISRLAQGCDMDEELFVLPELRQRLIRKSGEAVDVLELGRTIARSPETVSEWEAAIVAHVQTALRRKC